MRQYQVIAYKFPNGARLTVHRASRVCTVIAHWSPHVSTAIERIEAANALRRLRREWHPRTRPKPERA